MGNLLRPSFALRRHLIWVTVALLAGLLIARLPLWMAFALCGGTLVVLGSWREPLVAIGAALLLGPLRAWISAELPQIPAQIGQAFFFLAAAIWLARGLARREVRLPHPPLLWPLAGFLSVALLSLWSPADLWNGFTEWAKWGQLLVIFLLAYQRFQARDVTEHGAAIGVGLLVLVACGQAAVGIWQFGLRGDGPEHFAIGVGRYRAYGTFEQPNPYGGFLALSGALLAGLLLVLAAEWAQARWEGRPRSFRPWLWGGIGGALLLVGGGLLASWSRGAWLGFGAALLVMAAALPRRGWWGLLLILLIVGGGWGLHATGRLPAALSTRLTGFLDYTRFEDVRGAPINDANYAVLERMAHWQAALAMWRDNFWLGVGLGCYEAAYADYALLNWPIALGHAHNFYLNLLAEVGLVGLTAYLVFLGALFFSLWRATRRLTGLQRGLALGLLGAFTHFAVHSLVDNLLVNNVQLHLGVLLALAATAIIEPEETYEKRRELGSPLSS